VSAVSNTKYNLIAIALHWVMAICFFIMLGAGFAMSNLEFDPSLKFQIYQWHKSGGVLLLLAFFFRIVWRLFKPPPPLPNGLPALDVKAAKLGHYGLYALMIAMPLTGWLMVSASVYGLPTIVFDLFEWPHIPGIAGNEAIENIANRAHFILGILFSLMIAAHIGAVIKHHLKDKINLMPRMIPWRKAYKNLKEKD